MTPDELDQDWRSGCRADPLLSRMGPPPPASELVAAVLQRLQGGGDPPDPVLEGLAAGHASKQWDAPGQVIIRQLGVLVEVGVIATGSAAQEAVRVMSVVSVAAANIAIEAHRSQAVEDSLTRLPNHRGLHKELDRLRETGTAFVVASIDLDGLKAVNDSLGHEGGDNYIRDFGLRLQRVMTDQGGGAARYGGDEFAAYLPGGGESLTVILDALAADRDAPPFSFGIAAWPEEDSDLRTVLSVADRAMYAQKSAKKALKAAESVAPTDATPAEPHHHDPQGS